MTKSSKGLPLDGVLLLDKPLGKSSNFVLQKCKWLFNAKKAGHTGSLDPMASGMLPILFGQATKYSHFLLSSHKCYQVILRLGQKTSTGDSEGEVVAEKPIPVLTREQIEHVLAGFKGEQKQVPPMYSALKFQGRPLYALARQGKTIERAARAITIFALSLDEIRECSSLTLTVTCSKGTYIRTLAEDIAQALNTVGHVVFLRRLWVAPYEQERMHSLAFLETLNKEILQAQLISLQKAFATILPAITLSDEDIFYLFRGIQLTREQIEPIGQVVLKDIAGEFLGIGERRQDGKLIAWRLVQRNMQGEEKSLLSAV